MILAKYLGSQDEELGRVIMTKRKKILRWGLIGLSCLALIISLGIPVLLKNSSPISSYYVQKLVKLEADYIISCQYINKSNKSDPANGCINNVYGVPTWVVPRENALAILGLLRAYGLLNNSIYLYSAELAGDYLVNAQLPDGSWADQYEYNNAKINSKSPTQTAEVMIALYKLKHTQERYEAMINGAEFLLECKGVANKGGNNDGLICGGKDESGNWRTWRWTSDNSWAYLALRYTYAWAIENKDYNLYKKYYKASWEIIYGIEKFLKDPNTPVWYQAIDENGNPQWIDSANWIQYAPAMLNIPVKEKNLGKIGEWIHANLQKDDGSCIGYDNKAVRRYPGLTFQACITWFKSGHLNYINNSYNWVVNSGLWQLDKDQNGIKGGLIDWIEIEPNQGKKADYWQRFIDTSFYAISVLTGGYMF